MNSRDTESEQVIHAAYIDWVRARPFDLKVVREEGIENFGQFVLRQLDRVGLQVTHKSAPDRSDK